MDHIIRSKETGRISIELKAPRMMFDGKCYLDFSTIREITGINHSKLYRKLHQLKDLKIHSISYKNRIFFEESFILTHFLYL